MSLEKQLEHIGDEIDAARIKLDKLQDIVATARINDEPLKSYNELGKDRDLLRYTGGSLNAAIRLITVIMADTGGE